MLHKYNVQDLYAGNYTLLIKEIKEDLNKCGDVLHSWIGRLNVINIVNSSKETNSPKIDLEFNAIPVNSQEHFLYIWKSLTDMETHRP